MSKHSAKLILSPLIALFSVFILFQYTAVTAFAIGKWTLTGEMNVVHQNEPVAALQNGKYLIEGGLSGSGVTNVAELYDPTTGQWAQTGNLTIALGDTIYPIILNNGKVLIAGGTTTSDHNSPVKTAQLYDPATGQWTNTGDMNVQRTNQSMVKLLDGRVLAISGSQGNFNDDTPTCEIYDPATEQWTLTGSVSNPTFTSTAVLLNDGRVLKVGNAPGGASTVTEIYDPNAGSWSTTGSLITGIYQANLVKLNDGRVLKIGGDQWGNLIMESEIYDPATWQWTQTGSLNYARSGADAILLPDGRVLVAGGTDLSGNFILPSEIYDPVTGQWTVDASLNTGHQLAYMATLSNGKVLIASGNQKTAEVYSPTANLAPQVGAISVSSNPVQINTSLTASATFTDVNTGDTHTASWNWGDGSTTGTVTENNGSGSVIDNHTYTSPGVYTVMLTVSDGTASGSSTFEYVSAYDPQPSSHFGAARLITSPAGAYSAGPSLTGQVQFGVSTRYSGSNPVGSVSMDFPAAKFKFASTSISSLVVATTKATLRGSGTVNGISGYTFLVTGLDGSGSNGKIRFQIKDGSGNVVYDTQPGASDVTNPTTSVTGSVNVQ